MRIVTLEEQGVVLCVDCRRVLLASAGRICPECLAARKAKRLAEPPSEQPASEDVPVRRLPRK